MEKINKTYSSYVHISNSGYNFEVNVKDLGEVYVPSQFLTLELSSFGLPLSTTIWLDDNVIEALEYVLNKAKEQRKFFDLKPNAITTSKASPPHDMRESFSDETVQENKSDR